MRGAFHFRSFRQALAVAVAGFSALAVVFGLAAEPAMASSYKILHAFGANSTDGIGPAAPMIMDAKGNFYGTTSLAGANNAGTAFELTP